MSCVTHDAKLFLPMEELVDVDKELARIVKEKEKVQKGLAGVQAKLGNPGLPQRHRSRSSARSRRKPKSMPPCCVSSRRAKHG